MLIEIQSDEAQIIVLCYIRVIRLLHSACNWRLQQRHPKEFWIFHPFISELSLVFREDQVENTPAMAVLAFPLLDKLVLHDGKLNCSRTIRLWVTLDHGHGRARDCCMDPEDQSTSLQRIDEGDAEPDENFSELHKARRSLYGSHFLSAWGSRMWEFTVGLVSSFLIVVFRNSENFWNSASLVYKSFRPRFK